MKDNTDNTIDQIKSFFPLFFDGIPVSADVIDTSRGDDDFRKTFIIETGAGNKHVLKITANDFTFPEKISMWARTVEEYRSLGYYCPRIISDKKGGFPTVRFQERDCVVYAEEYSKYKSFEDRAACGDNDEGPDRGRYAKDIWSMTARIAARKLDYTDYPSAYCLFETFCPSDRTDEVLENAMEWKKLALSLPDEFSAQVQRMWDLWHNNRQALKEPYSRLPTSVFQADLNTTNLLVDDDGCFKGIYDFNLCGKDVFLNYLIRENGGDFEEEIEHIRAALKISCGYYTFSEEEKEAALPLYRCLKPLWWTRVRDLKKAGNDREAVKRCLDRTEYYLTEDIDFKTYME